MDLTGGTPEVVIAAIVVGFKRVFFFGDENEQAMMQLPTREEVVDSARCHTTAAVCKSSVVSPPISVLQSAFRNDAMAYQNHRYESPDPSSPSRVDLAAAAVRGLAT